MSLQPLNPPIAIRLTDGEHPVLLEAREAGRSDAGLKASVIIGNGHVIRSDTVALMNAAARKEFAAQAAAGAGLDAAVIEGELVHLGDEVDAQLREAGQGRPAGGDMGEDRAQALRLSDAGNAERFAAACADKLLYCAPLKRWYVWDGRRWAEDRQNEHQEYAKRVAKSIYDEAKDEEDPERRRDLTKWALQSQNERRIKAMLELAKSDPALTVTDDELDDPEATAGLLNCRNGVLDLETLTLHPHSPERRFTKLIDLDYDPQAECPRWLTYLEGVTNGDAALRDFLQRAVGVTLSGRPRERVLFILYGEGANGKSTFLELLLELFSDFGVVTPPETLMRRRGGSGGIRTDLVTLKGARFVSASEGEEGGRFDVATVKRLTGGDTISARPLYASEITFRPTFLIWFATNHRPSIADTTEGAWDRMRTVPFTRRFHKVEELTEEQRRRRDSALEKGEFDPFPPMDRELKSALQRELPGILAWAVDGYRKYRVDGVLTCPAVRNATEDHRKEDDIFGHWLEECCCTEYSEVATAVGDLYESYKGWCEQNTYRPLTSVKFAEELAKRGYPADRTATARLRRGIGLLAGPMTG